MDSSKWYFVEGNASKGPFSQEEMSRMLAEGLINGDTFVFTQGMTNWTLLKETSLSSAPAQQAEEIMEAVQASPVEEEIIVVEEAVQPEEQVQPAQTEPAAQAEPAAKAEPIVQAEPVIQAQPVQHEQPAKSAPAKEEAAVWYYVKNQKIEGPFTREVVVSRIESGVLNADTYVWKEGMADWQHISDTEFRMYVPKKAASPRQQQPSGTQPTGGQSFAAQPAPQQHRAPVEGQAGVRSIGLWFFLSVLTCGIGAFVWMYLAAADIQKLEARTGGHQAVDPALAVILSIFTCGLYVPYFFWKEQTVLNSLQEKAGMKSQANPVVMLVLSFFVEIIALAIMQDEINSLVQQ